MAQLHIDADMLTPGCWRVESSHAGALAAITDAFVQQVPQSADDVVSVWALHPTEQDGLRSDAYHHELAELGAGAQAEVVELPRPHQHNVVWVDRFHLCATGGPASSASRILGMYVGTRGSCAVYLHAPMTTAAVVEHVWQLPQGATAQGRAHGARGWNEGGITEQCRLVVHHDASRPRGVDVRCQRDASHDMMVALQRLQAIVATW